MADKDTDLDKIKKLIKIMKDNELVEVEIQHGDQRISLRRCEPQSSAAPVVTGVPLAPQPPVSAPATAEPAEAARPAQPVQEELIDIKSPIVGTFYATPSPDSEPYVEPGSHVEPQTVVCIIEAMKVMNEIRAETTGTIVEVLATNGQAVEYGQVLFKVRPE